MGLMMAVDHDHVTTYVIYAIVNGFFLGPFIWVWKDPDNVTARLVLFWVNLINWIIGLTAFILITLFVFLAVGLTHGTT